MYTTRFIIIVVWFVPRFYLFFLSNHQHRVFREAIGYEDLNNYHIHENMTWDAQLYVSGFQRNGKYKRST